jgi:ubiquinone/menaquinone biosynthesis C-methylase UbiE
MAVPFDHIASTYESVLSRNAVGQLQRKIVWKYVERIIPELNGLEVLELNWGCDEDAMMFSDKGYNIIATDVSMEMLSITQEKAQSYSFSGRLSSQYLDLDAVHETLQERKYDLIISNFGGLNCINPEALQKFFSKLPGMLSPKGRFVGVIMNRFCLMESLYYMAKFQFKKAFRRWTKKEVRLRLNGNSLTTWYYRPAIIREWVQRYFNVVDLRAVGIVLPPFHLSTFLLRKKKLLYHLNKLEKSLDSSSLFSGLSDHFLIDLKAKGI